MNQYDEYANFEPSSPKTVKPVTKSKPPKQGSTEKPAASPTTQGSPDNTTKPPLENLYANLDGIAEKPSKPEPPRKLPKQLAADGPTTSTPLHDTSVPTPVDGCAGTVYSNLPPPTEESAHVPLTTSSSLSIC